MKRRRGFSRVRHGWGFNGLVALAIAASLLGCSKKSAPTESVQNTNTSEKAENTGAHADAGTSTTAAEGTAKEPQGAAEAFAGSYTMAVGTMYVPDDPEFKTVRFKNDETKMLGPGKLSLAISPSGRVSGESEGGPLGAAIVEGRIDGDQFAASIHRKDANDEGLTGTLVGTRKGDTLEGTMNLSEWNATVVREAKFTAQRGAK